MTFQFLKKLKKKKLERRNSKKSNEKTDDKDGSGASGSANMVISSKRGVTTVKRHAQVLFSIDRPESLQKLQYLHRPLTSAQQVYIGQLIDSQVFGANPDVYGDIHVTKKSGRDQLQAFVSTSVNDTSQPHVYWSRKPNANGEFISVETRQSYKNRTGQKPPFDLGKYRAELNRNASDILDEIKARPHGAIASEGDAWYDSFSIFDEDIAAFDKPLFGALCVSTYMHNDQPFGSIILI